MLLIKYGCILTADNKAGTDLDVAVFSDPYGATTTCTVAEGDTVLHANIDPDTFALTGELWQVHDGSEWERAVFNDDPDNPIINPPAGELGISLAPDVPYQTGSMVVFLPDGSFTSVNLSVTMSLIDAAIAAALAP